MQFTLTTDAATVMLRHLADDRAHFEQEAANALPADAVWMREYTEAIGHMVDALDTAGTVEVPPVVQGYMREHLRELIDETDGHRGEFGALLDTLEAA